MSAITDTSTMALHEASAGALHASAALGQKPPLHRGNSFTLRGAAEWCNVSVDTIKRRRRDGLFPGAEIVDGAWRVPSSELMTVASESGWVLGLIDLPKLERVAEATPYAGRHAIAPASPGADEVDLNGAQVAELEARLAILPQLHRVELDAKDVLHAAELGAATTELDRVTAERDRHCFDVDQLRAELEKVKADKAEAEKRTAVAEAVATERAELIGRLEASSGVARQIAH